MRHILGRINRILAVLILAVLLLPWSSRDPRVARAACPVTAENWQEVGTDSACAGGISHSTGGSPALPSLAIAPDGTPYVVWNQYFTGHPSEIYVRRWNGSDWEEVGAGSATGGGISNNSGGSGHPSLAIAPDSTPYVAWQDDSGGNRAIYVRRWNGSGWEEVGTGSATDGGISGTSYNADPPSAAFAPDGTLYVAWAGFSGSRQIYVLRWTGNSWEEVGAGSASAGGISNTMEDSLRSSVAVAPDGTPYVAWEQRPVENEEIYVRRWSGSDWEEVGAGSATGGGISENSHHSIYPSIAIGPHGIPYVAWHDHSGGDEEIYVRRWNGSDWEEVGIGSATAGGISDNSDTSWFPSAAVAPDGTPYVVWNDNSGGVYEIYVRRWNGSSWEEVGVGSATGGGISNGGEHADAASLAVAPDGTPYVAWHDTSSGAGEIYVRRWEGEPYSVSGHVRDGSSAPIGGVTVLTDSGASATTDISGNYTILNLAPGTHVLRPSKMGYAFIPDAITIDLDSDQSGANFLGKSIACVAPLSQPFLQFPLADYRTFESFASAARDTDDADESGNGGLLNSWFDHHTPTYTPPNDDIRLYTSEAYTESEGDHVWGGLHCWTNTDDEDDETLQYCYDNHNGYDIVRPSDGEDNPDIYAADEGLVVACCSEGKDGCEGDCWPLGRQVWVDHGNNYATLYGHLEAVSVTVGTTVTADTALGTMGDTGNSYGTHLHFGVYFNWNLRDPWITSITSVRSDEVVDPFGWDGLERTRPVSDTWDTPSVNLWEHAPRVASLYDNSGGQFRSPSDRIAVDIPPGALRELTLMTLREGPVSAPSATLRSVGSAFWLRALWDWATGESTLQAQTQAADLAKPITVTMSYTDSALRHLDAAQLTIRHWDEAGRSWQQLDTTSDALGRTAAAQTSELGAFDLQAPLVCPGDVLEPNDRYATASQLTTSEPIRTLFDIPDDEDWFRLEAVRGTTYTLQTSELATGVNTIVELYDTDAATLLAQHDGGEGLTSRLVWTAPATRSFYVRALPGAASVTGCNARYALSLVAHSNEFTHRIYLPLVLRQP